MTEQIEEPVENMAFEIELRKARAVYKGDPERYWLLRFQRYSKFNRSKRKFRAIREGDEYEVLSTLAEIRWALIFAGLGFGIEVEPLGNEGPDLAICRDGKREFVEVKYIANVNPKPPGTLDLRAERVAGDGPSLDSILTPYGDHGRDVGKIKDIIRDILKTGKKETSIIVVWDEREDNDPDLAIREAVCDLIKAGEFPDSLFFLAFRSVHSRRYEFFCYPLTKRTEPCWQWMWELQQSHPTTLIQRALDAT